MTTKTKTFLVREDPTTSFRPIKPQTEKGPILAQHAQRWVLTLQVAPKNYCAL